MQVRLEKMQDHVAGLIARLQQVRPATSCWCHKFVMPAIMLTQKKTLEASVACSRYHCAAWQHVVWMAMCGVHKCAETGCLL